ncbi:MAG: hypothetical protein MZV70_19460 [Desulfobacterales bacterium]|nr:hypothetical protein [Desulfobacterales bacterium]
MSEAAEAEAPERGLAAAARAGRRGARHGACDAWRDARCSGSPTSASNRGSSRSAAQPPRAARRGSCRFRPSGCARPWRGSDSTPRVGRSQPRRFVFSDEVGGGVGVLSGRPGRPPFSGRTTWR